MRLIDADALMRKFKTASPMAIDGRARQIVDDMPTIEERKTGKWVDKDGGLATCSECGDRWGVWSVMHYCPNCGAEMKASE